jgi:hypothetical protein
MSLPPPIAKSGLPPPLPPMAALRPWMILPAWWPALTAAGEQKATRLALVAEGGAELHDAVAELGEDLRAEAAENLLVGNAHDGGDEFEAVAHGGFGGEFLGYAGERLFAGRL